MNTQPLPEPPPSRPGGRGRTLLRVGAVTTGSALVLAAGSGVVLAAAAHGQGMATGMSSASATGSTTPDKQSCTVGKEKDRAGKKPSTHGTTMEPGTKVDPAKQKWAHTYGVDRATMPNLAPVDKATAAQKAAATKLLQETEKATAKYANVSVARAAGYRLTAHLARVEKRKPALAKAIARYDKRLAAGKCTRSPMLHVPNKAFRHDGKVLDTQAPETLMYAYTGHGAWKLIGVMYTANEAYPKAPPDPGGPITRWHYHDKHGGQGLMMHVFFGYGTDLSHAYEAEMNMS